MKTKLGELEKVSNKELSPEEEKMERDYNKRLNNFNKGLDKLQARWNIELEQVAFINFKDNKQYEETKKGSKGSKKGSTKKSSK